MEHCLLCDRCVTQYQFHSAFFGKCFGHSNMVWYTLYQTMELVIAYLYVSDLLTQHSHESDFESDFQKPFYVVYFMSTACKLLLFGCVVWLVKAFDKWVQTYSSIAAGMTLNEFLNSWNYKYLFQLREDAKYHHKKVTLCQSTVNFVRFFCACRRRGNKRHRVTKPATEQYELQTIIS